MGKCCSSCRLGGIKYRKREQGEDEEYDEENQEEDSFNDNRNKVKSLALQFEEDKIKQRKKEFVTYFQKGRHEQKITKRIEKSMERFELKPRDAYKIWKKFIQYDKDVENYINLDDLYYMIRERSTSIIAPYLERLYELIDKREEDKIFFDEFLHAITAFCLFSRDEMVMFVFKMFDKDRDDYISKKDVYRHLMLERERMMIYPINNLRAVELFKCERGDRIDRNILPPSIKYF